MKITAVVPAAGKGNRLNTNIDKVFFLLDKRPILFYTLQSLAELEKIKEIILVVSERYLDYTQNKFLKNFVFPKVKKVIIGGRTRADSVWNGLKEVSKDTDFVLIHDAARPFIDQASLKKVVSAGMKYKAAALGISVTSTIKRINNSYAVETVKREFLWEIQTPQVFKRDLILDCYQRAMRENFIATDDAQVLEHCGYKVRAVEGSLLNIKITEPEDLILAKAILWIKATRLQRLNRGKSR